ncbi:type II secretion system protein [Candidatus Saccharibacteria bacterium]|nr:type II secretion system protein [Candidatus Saccharibacteria bacterium]
MLNNIKRIQKDKGFTIVELLIVIVVIGILAAITLVAYGNITTRANANAAKANAANVAKVAEAYNADEVNTTYATSAGVLSTYNGISRVPSGLTVQATAVTSANANGKTIMYLPRAGNTGGCVGYWDATIPAAVYVYVGNATGGVPATPTCT